MLRRGYLGDSECQLVDEIFRFVPVARGHLRDEVMGALVGEPVVVHEGHRVYPDDVVHDELHARQTDATDRQPPVAGGSRRLGDVYHHAGAGRRQALQVDILGLVAQAALVDITLGPLGAG